jgi:hypothetical protein
VIDEVQQRLREWVASVVADAQISFEPPTGERTQREVSLYLVEMLPKPVARGTRTQMVQVALRYLVTATAKDPLEAATLLSELLFAAIKNPEWEIRSEPIPLETWPSFSRIPRPSFLLEVALRRERPQKPAPYVRVPLVVRDSPMEALEGIVLGPDEIPLTGANVELPGLQLSTRTDARGRFRFPAVPSEPSSKVVRVRAKGRITSLKTRPASFEDGRLVIRFREMEA